jgi:ferredoxin
VNVIAIPKNKIEEFLQKITESSWRLVAPVKADEILDWKEIDSAAQVCIDDGITLKSLKEFFFPQAEMFLKFTESGEPVETIVYRDTVIFGARPCDLYALKVLTEVFSKGAFSDPFFVEHKKKTLIVGLGCINEKPGCFCKDRGIEKGFSADCDVFLNDAGDYYTAEVLTEAGQSLIDRFLPGCRKIDADKAPVHTGKESGAALELCADEKELFEKIDWEKISETCLGCGTCTFVCGTCHCFAFQDVTEKGETKRYRCWDSCMYPKFTLHASGHNPRPSKKERYRQRLLHKFLYIKENYGLTACSGCGRCNRSCPVGINIRSAVKKIMEEITFRGEST